MLLGFLFVIINKTNEKVHKKFFLKILNFV